MSSGSGNDKGMVDHEGVDDSEKTESDGEWHIAVGEASVYTVRLVRHRQEEWEATIHDRCRSRLREVVYGWDELLSRIGRGGWVRVSHQLHVAFDHCGRVLGYNIETSKARVELEAEVNGVKIGTIPRRMITKIHRPVSDPMSGQKIE